MGGGDGWWQTGEVSEWGAVLEQRRRGPPEKPGVAMRASDVFLAFFSVAIRLHLWLFDTTASGEQASVFAIWIRFVTMFCRSILRLATPRL